MPEPRKKLLIALLGSTLLLSVPVVISLARESAGAFVTGEVGPVSLTPAPLTVATVEPASLSLAPPPAAPALPTGTAEVAHLANLPATHPWISRSSLAQSIDPLTTAAVGTAPAVALPAGSAEFRHALETLSAKHYADAYEEAKALADPVERRAVQWAAIYYGYGAVDYDAVKRFATDAPAFDTPTIYRTRLEQSFTRSSHAPSEVIATLGGAMPVTIQGQIALAAAYKADGQTQRAAGIARQIWVDNYLDAKLETQVLAKLGDLLDSDAHWQRAMHLMMHDRATGTERLFKFMTPAQKSLALARNAVSRHAKNAKSLLDAVDPAYQDNPVYIFSRAQRARQFGLFESAVDWLKKGPADRPDAEEWWYETQNLVRQLLSAGNPKLAYQAAASYRTGPDGRLVEAHFNAGWIALSFLGDAATAKAEFSAMRQYSTLPDSVAQANFWLGRALAKLGDTAGATVAYSEAASHGTVYYGLLARQALGETGAALRDMPAWQDREPQFNANEAIKAVQLFAGNNRQSYGIALLRNISADMTEGGDLLLAARLAQRLNAHHLAISIADVSEKRGMPLDLFAFPKDGLPQTALVASIDKAAVYAIARQESRFQVDAMSSVGARGLMQLMPATAKETAAKVGVPYSASRLTSDGAYNALLGSQYLSDQLDRFDGSLLLAAAAYNAGGGNANKWIKAYGDPRNAKVDPVVWVELIPFTETRKYVQRVLGNYMVYRARLGDTGMTIEQAMRGLEG